MTDEKNLELWHRYGITNPAHTKPVSYGRKFTAIDTYYQIMRATEAFGPFGKGWGWEADNETIVAVDVSDKTHTFAKVALKLWYMDGEKCCECGPVIAMNMLVSSKGVPDEEAFKKATTDALTKALSYLGFSADVFMGKFDDNRYVEGLKAKFAKEEVEKTKDLPSPIQKAIDELKELATEAALLASWNSIKPAYDKLPVAQQSYVRLQWTRRREALAPTPE